MIKDVHTEKSCIFCDRRAESREHLWSNALGPDIERVAKGSLNRSYKALDFGGPSDVERHGMPMHRTTIKCVCHPCNNGWMNRLDELVRNKLLRLIRDQNATYTHNEARYLASWLCMKMMVRDQYARTVSTFTRDQTVNFYLSGLPEKNMSIQLGRCGAPIWASAFHRQGKGHFSLTEAGIVNTAISTMGLGNAVAFAEYGSAQFDTSPLPSQRLIQIWPNPTEFKWPPAAKLKTEEVSEYATRYFPERHSAAESAENFRENFSPHQSAPKNRKERRAERKGR